MHITWKPVVGIVGALVLIGALIWGGIAIRDTMQHNSEVQAAQEHDQLAAGAAAAEQASDSVSGLTATVVTVGEKAKAEKAAVELAAQQKAAADAAAQQAAEDAAAKNAAKPKTQTVTGPIKCPAGSSANSGDAGNDTSCFPNICFHIVLPDPAHPECVTPFKP